MALAFSSRAVGLDAMSRARSDSTVSIVAAGDRPRGRRGLDPARVPREDRDHGAVLHGEADLLATLGDRGGGSTRHPAASCASRRGCGPRGSWRTAALVQRQCRAASTDEALDCDGDVAGPGGSGSCSWGTWADLSKRPRGPVVRVADGPRASETGSQNALARWTRSTAAGGGPGSLSRLISRVSWGLICPDFSARRLLWRDPRLSLEAANPSTPHFSGTPIPDGPRALARRLGPVRLPAHLPESAGGADFAPRFLVVASSPSLSWRWQTLPRICVIPYSGA